MRVLSKEDTLIYAPSSGQNFAMRLAESLSIPLGNVEEKKFPDGEFTIRPIDNVRGKTILAVQSLFRDSQSSIPDKLCELLFLGRALKDAAAANVILIAPYLCFARLDRQMAFQGPVSTRSLAEFIETAGFDLVVTMDVHNLSAYQNSFRCPTLHLSAVDLFAHSIVPSMNLAEITVVSPDLGGMKRCETLCQTIREMSGYDVGLSVVMKHRIDHVVSDEIFLGNVEGRSIIILDDMISTGTTIAHAVTICQRQGAKRITVAATHGLFAAEAESILQDLPIEQFLVTNTVVPYRLESERFRHSIKILDVVPVFTSLIQQILV